ncbi:MAG TPA: TolC family protein [Polyangia bacterium]|jgi:outer membrane protein TolC|nr:TolC family protein [Polyangia bacterium]
MKRARVPLARTAAVAVAALVLVGAARPAAARRYTLPELIAQVNASYPGVQAARQGVESADAQLSQATRLWWPTGQLTFGITGSPEVRCIDPVTGKPWTQGGDQARALSSCIRTDVVDLRSGEQVLPYHGVAFNLGLNLIQPLYTFGKIEATRNAAQAGLDSARAQVDKDRAEVTFNVTRAYWLLKWARAAEATLDDGITRLKDWVKKINDEIDKGKTTYTENDLVRLKLALDAAELTALDVDKAKELGLSGLRMLTDDDAADIDDSELDITDAGVEPLSYFEDAARTHRAEARMLAAGAKATRANKALQLANLLPDLGIALSFTYAYAQSVDDPQNGFMNHPNALGAGLSLVMRYNLDVAERLANRSKASSDNRMMVERRKQALGGIYIEIENAWLDARAARRRSDLLAHSEKVARGWYNAVDENLQIGVAESRDLVDAARNFFELRMRHLQSIMDVNMATATLKQTAGVLVQ